MIGCGFLPGELTGFLSPRSLAASILPNRTVIFTNHLLEQKKMASIHILNYSEFERFCEITVHFDYLLLAAACA